MGGDAKATFCQVVKEMNAGGVRSHSRQGVPLMLPCPRARLVGDVSHA